MLRRRKETASVAESPVIGRRIARSLIPESQMDPRKMKRSSRRGKRHLQRQARLRSKSMARPFAGVATCRRWTTTHDTATHTGKRVGNGAAANISLVPDPAAWSCVFTGEPDDFDEGSSYGNPKDAWNLPSQFLVLVMFIFGPMCFEMIGRLLVEHPWAMGPWLGMWFGIGLSVLYLKTTVGSDPDPVNRRARRHYVKEYRRNRRRQRSLDRNPGSIRDHGLHRRYPLNLRDMGHFIRGRLPTYMDRDLRASGQAFLRNLYQKVFGNGYRRSPPWPGERKSKGRNDCASSVCRRPHHQCHPRPLETVPSACAQRLSQEA